MKQNKKSALLLALLITGVTVFVVANTVKAGTNFSIENVYGKKPKKITKSNKTCSDSIQELTIEGQAGSKVSLSKPQAVALDSQSNIYIADTRVNQIKKFNANGELLKMWGRQAGECGKAPGEFCSPYDIALDGNDNLYVADYRNHRVQKLSATSGTWEVWCKKITNNQGQQVCAMSRENGGFWYPRAIAADNISVYVADANKKVQVLHANGNFVQSFIVRGTVNDIAINPAYTDVGATSLYLAVGNYIKKINVNNNIWTEEQSNVWPLMSKGIVALSLDNNGNIYTANSSGKRFSKYSSTGNTLIEYQHITNQCPIGRSQGAAFANGSLYVMDWANDRLLKIKEAQN